MSLAANAFVQYRNLCQLQKRAADGGPGWGAVLGDMAGSAGKYLMDNPWAMGALGGGVIGGASGLFSDRPGSVLRNALVGAGLGGLGGYGYSKFKDYQLGEQRKIEAAQQEEQRKLDAAKQKAEIEAQSEKEVIKPEMALGKQPGWSMQQQLGGAPVSTEAGGANNPLLSSLGGPVPKNEQEASDMAMASKVHEIQQGLEQGRALGLDRDPETFSRWNDGENWEKLRAASIEWHRVNDALHGATPTAAPATLGSVVSNLVGRVQGAAGGAIDSIGKNISTVGGAARDMAATGLSGLQEGGKAIRDAASGAIQQGVDKLDRMTRPGGSAAGPAGSAAAKAEAEAAQAAQVEAALRRFAPR